MKFLQHPATVLLLALATPPGHAQAPAGPAQALARPAQALAGPAQALARPAQAQARPAQTPAIKSPTPRPRPSSSPAPQLPGPHLPALPAPTTGPLNRLLIVLDPAHGGLDTGSRIGESILEKDVTLALAFKLRSLLTARGFAVTMTRDADAATGPNASGTSLTLDDRAGIANHARPVACLLLHATGSGTGVHLYNSELDPAPGETSILPWLTAQAAWVPQSRALARQLAEALTRATVPLVLSSASVRPVDSLTCPALIVEIAPETSDPSTITAADYQQRIASAIAGVLIFWKDQAQPPIRLSTPSLSTPSAGAPRP